MEQEIIKFTGNVSLTTVKRQCYAFMGVENVTEAFNDPNSFINKYSAQNQALLVKSLDDVWFGMHPTLTVINKAFPGHVQIWLRRHLEEMQKYLGPRGRFTEEQLYQLPQHIFLEFPWLKVSELMYFFWLCKDEVFGTIYGHIDPPYIMSALRIFVTEYRNPAIDEGIGKIEAAYYRWHDQDAVKGRDFNRELPAILLAKEDEQKKQVQPSGENTDAVLESAKALVNNTLGFSEDVVIAMCKSWAARYGCSPEDYMNSHKE